MNSATLFILGAVVVFGNARSTDKIPHEDSNIVKLLSQPPMCPTATGHQKGGNQHFLQLFDRDNSVRWPADYQETRDVGEIASDDTDYTLDDGSLGLGLSKRASVSPYLSFGALTNLQQFFDDLKGSMDRQEQLQQQNQIQAQVAAAAELDRGFRPPSTAAVLHAFRNYRPLRRTRSYPPALMLQG